MIRFASLSVVLLLTITLHAQTIEKCSLDVLKTTSENMKNLTQKQISNFFLTFDRSCKTVIEYSEWSNELLFDILDQHTALALRTLERDETRISINAILEDLSSPLLDKVDIRKLITKVEKVKMDLRLQKLILESLKTDALTE